jgi:hypothetical protein
MIYRDLKYQGNPPLDYQCRLKKLKKKIEGRSFPEVDGERANGGEYGWMYFVLIYENRRMKPVEIVLRRRKGGRGRTM